jgi:hypothetical protein
LVVLDNVKRTVTTEAIGVARTSSCATIITKGTEANCITIIRGILARTAIVAVVWTWFDQISAYAIHTYATQTGTV